MIFESVGSTRLIFFFFFGVFSFCHHLISVSFDLQISMNALSNTFLWCIANMWVFHRSRITYSLYFSYTTVLWWFFIFFFHFSLFMISLLCFFPVNNNSLFYYWCWWRYQTFVLIHPFHKSTLYLSLNIFQLILQYLRFVLYLFFLTAFLLSFWIHVS